VGVGLKMSEPNVKLDLNLTPLYANATILCFGGSVALTFSPAVALLCMGVVYLALSIIGCL
jgi:hypothetical protein